MASAQVLPDSAAASRKLGHLEAGKKKLEEFRKRKAEERAKKASSTIQLPLIDGCNNEKSSQKHEHEGDRTTHNTSIGFHGSYTPLQKDAFSSTDKHVISSNENTEMIDSYDKFSYTGLVNGFHDHWQERNEPINNEQSKFETAAPSALDHFTAADSSHTNVDLVSSLGSLNFYSSPSDEIRNSSSAQLSYLDASSTAGIEKSETAAAESKLGLPSTSLNLSSVFKDSSSGLGIYNSGSFNNESIIESQAGQKTISESISQHLNLGRASWHSSGSFSTDSSQLIRSSPEAYSSPSTSYPVISGRSRPSFLDTLGVSRASSVSRVSPPKHTPPLSFSDTKAQSAEIHFPSHQHPYNMDTLQRPSSSSPSDLFNEEMNSFVSNDIRKMEKSSEFLQGNHENFVPKKDEEFSTLEQHIEDLTQEKFALQRALDTSRVLAESLAAENSSLTESYNQQAKFVSELKSDIERLQGQVKDQLGEIDSLKIEYGHAQLECNAADERAKILASEVIGLEEKALRLRSNELKLEKQLENFLSEIASYKRKVSSLERERQDFQSTINIMQEEKKVLQSKLKKASSNSKVDDALKVSSNSRDMSTSTNDLGDDLSRTRNKEEIMARNTMNAFQNDTASDFGTSTSSLPDDRSLYLPAGFVGIPYDQLRMIDNINSLTSELALEKEELMHALTFESSNTSKLKDLNKELSRKLEAQTQRLELLTAQRMANEHILIKSTDTHNFSDTSEYADEGDEVVERVLGWIMKFFPGGSSKRRTSKLL